MPQHFGRTATHLGFYQVAHYDDERSTLSSLQTCTCIKLGKDRKKEKRARMGNELWLDFYPQGKIKRDKISKANIKQHESLARKRMM